jgi:hypothetical protein
MPTTPVQTSDSRNEFLDLAIDQLRRAKDLNRQAEKLKRDLNINNIDPATVDTQVQGMLDAAEDLADGAKATIDLADWKHQIVVSIGQPGAYASCGIDIDNSSDAILTAANSSTPFTPFAAGDIVQLSNTSRAAHSDVRTVKGTSGNTLTLEEVLTDLDTTADTTIRVTLLEYYHA